MPSTISKKHQSVLKRAKSVFISGNNVLGQSPNSDDLELLPLSVEPEDIAALVPLKKIYLHQKSQPVSSECVYPTTTKYKFRSGPREDLLEVEESQSCLKQQICETYRPFKMAVKDMSGQEVIQFHRPLACGSCLLPKCLQELQVFSPPGNFIGSVEQEWTVLYPKFVIKNAVGKVLLRIQGPLAVACCLWNDQEFLIYSPEGGKAVGIIAELQSGSGRDTLSSENNLCIQFPPESDLTVKAILLGASMLINFMFYEH